MSDSMWYKDAILYEARVRAFYDSDGDGIGDFRGLAEKLDYLRELGVTAIWLLPFYPSPLMDDGYDISDYTGVHADCGTLRDFRHFVKEAHKRDLRVITELVLNHTSDQHAWFQRARKAGPNTKARNFYVWSDDPEQWSDARIIFKDFENSNWTWDRDAQAYFWHRFYSNQPDLNFDNPAVQKAVFRVLDFWLSMGVDGLRLDAVPYLYERAGTNCENLPETHAFLRALRRHIDDNFPDRMLLGEANQWPEDAVAYFGNGDECQMTFHFPIMPRLFMSLHMEDRHPIVDILEQTPAIPDSSQWALFLRNHDELTLEMVTDEERDYMYRVYAREQRARINLGIRRRLAPLLGNDRRRIELMNGLLFSLPGTPVLYYGDEIGMGDNIYLGDRHGVRTPMQWSADKNAGFSRANPQRLYLPIVVDPEYHYESVNVEAQEHNPSSLLWWMRRLISLRKRFRAFGRGTLEMLHPRNRKVLAFVREYEDEKILVVANLSRYVQYVELDLSPCRGSVAVELFGGNVFPPIGDLPYLLTIGPHGFYWFLLRPQEEGAARLEPVAPARLEAKGDWTDVLSDDARDLVAALPAWLRRQRWFGGKGRTIKRVKLGDNVPIRDDGRVEAVIAFVTVEFTDGVPEDYLVSFAFAIGARQVDLERHHPETLIARLAVDTGERVDEGILHDGLRNPTVGSTLLAAIERRRKLRGSTGTLVSARVRDFEEIAGDATIELPRIASWEQSNSSLLFGDRLILKIFRRAGGGVNPELEIGRFLAEHGFEHVPPLAGSLEYQTNGESITVGVLQGMVTNEGDAWEFTLDEVERYFERVLTDDRDFRHVPVPRREPLQLTGREPPELAAGLIGGYLDTAALMGVRTAGLHAAISSDPDDAAFAPEPFSKLYQRSLYQSMRNLTRRVYRLLNDALPSLPDDVRRQAERIVDRQDEILGVFAKLSERRLEAVRTRVHGDLHLGQMLFTGKDFVFLDFEGEPARPVSERRIKRTPLADVAGMLRSFEYAVSTVLTTRVLGPMASEEQSEQLERWARLWYKWVAAAFLDGYFSNAVNATFLPADRGDVAVLLEISLLEKAVYELGYELNNRPDWVWVPLGGIIRLLESHTAGSRE
jgi:maltose alpha-D-glucosyltransferase/alpha-amylase